MNLHKIANAHIAAVHPNETVTLYISKGQQNIMGIVKPLYLAPKEIDVQVQDDADSGLQLTDTVNKNAISKRFYMNKFEADELLTPAALIRQQERNGDIVKREDGTYYLITQVLEEFDLHVVFKGELLTVEPDFSEQDWYDKENSGK